MSSTLDKSNVEDIVGLTPTQEGILFHYLKDPHNAQYNEQLCLDIEGNIDISTFEKAWQHVVDTNEMLRTVMRWEETKNPVQIVLKKHDVKFSTLDLSSLAENESEAQFNKLLSEDREKGFDLLEVPFRIVVCKMGYAEYKVVISNHHIIYDGWSNGILLRDFGTAYSSLLNQRPLQKTARPKFKEFVKCLQKQDKKMQKEYWGKYLAGIDVQKDLPVQFEGRFQKPEITSREYVLKTSIENAARENHVTLAALLYSAWGVLMQKYNNCRDVVFGTTVSGRNIEVPGIGNTVGLCINTLPLVISNSKGQTASALLKTVNQDLALRTEFENTSLVDIKQHGKINSPGDIFNTIFVIENYPLDSSSIAQNTGFTIKDYLINESTNYNLTVSVETFNELKLKLTYDQCLYSEEWIQRLLSHYENILETMAKDPQIKVSEISLATEEEINQILKEFNDTHAPYPSDKTIQELFEERVRKTPENTAVICKDKTLTYLELNRKVNELAHVLREKGVGPDAIVGLYVERSFEMIIGVFAILKAGGAYLPIDPLLPKGRTKFIVSDSGVKIILTQEKFMDAICNYDLECEFINLNNADAYSGDADNPTIINSPKDLAYVIYTSGSTGNPKGAMIEHTSAVNRINWMQKAYGIGENDAIIQKTPYVFDVSVWELMWWSFVGAAVTMLEPHGESNPKLIIETIVGDSVTTMHFVPSMLNIFLEYLEDNPQEVNRLKSLRQVFASGEALTLSQVKRFNKLLHKNNGTRLINLYGPTEATVDVSYFNCSEDANLTTIPIGKPIDNIGLYIVSEEMKLQPVGVAGELCIGGVGVGRGYINRSELTAEKFVDNPFKAGEKLYRTGDLTRWMSDGNIEYLGRMDFQVKVRGFRIELGEIENCLMSYEGIKDAVAVAKQYSDGEKYLTAYVVTAKDISGSEIKNFLQSKLPEYMVPSFIVRLDKIPLTSNGKANRKELINRKDLSSEFDYASNTVTKAEEDILKIWQEILENDQIGIDDNFFDVGGNSLKSIRLVSRLSKIFEKEVPITSVFRFPTVRKLAKSLSTEGDDSEKIENSLAKEEENGQNTELVAVIGMAGRFPGARNITELWHNLIDGRETITFFEEQELIDSGIDAKTVNKPNYVKAKGIIDDLEYFDAEFFGYTPKEAEMMDPQIRILHECAWEALEDAGCNPDEYPGLIAAYIGASSNYYWLNKIANQSNSTDLFKAMILNERDFLSTRIAYKLNLKGPCVTIQTACSTALVGIDAACQDIISGKCDMAIAGGVGITYPIKTGYLYEDGMIFSPDGHCRAFDENAKGTVAGNGIGIVVLKRLSNAARDNDNIYAVVKASAVNNDGNRKVGYTAPSIEGQAEVIKAAHKKAKIVPSDISYVETHGTGTPLGDVAELEALKLAFGNSGKGHCAIGSIKSNVGHLDSAAGAAGFIKAVLTVKNRKIPPTLHVIKPNSKINIDESPFFVNGSLLDFDKDKELIAGVSSFGIGGTNAHAIIGEAPKLQCSKQERDYKILTLSAKTEKALGRAMESLLDFLKQQPNVNLANVAYTLQTGRKQFGYSKTIVARDVEEAIKLLSDNEYKNQNIISAKAGTWPVVFMFSGQGSHYVNMGLDLYKNEPVFKYEMDKCLSLIKEYSGADFENIIYPSADVGEAREKLRSSQFNQPLIFAFEYAMARLIMSFGIKPDYMIGYSLGEYVAACISGVMELNDAISLVVLRGKHISTSKNGAMLSVPMDAQEVKPMLYDGVSIAIDNGPSCVVAGAKEEIDEFQKTLMAKRILCTRLSSSYAVHTSMMESVAGEMREALREIKLNRPLIPYISDVTGEFISEDAVDSEYWIKHLTGTVNFAKGMREIIINRNAVLIEIGPNRDLCVLARHFIKEPGNYLVLNTARHEMETHNDTQYLYNRIGQLWGYQKRIDWEAFYRDEKRIKVSVPTYSFEKQKFSIQISQVASSKRQVKADECYYAPTWKRNAIFTNQPQNQKSLWVVFQDNLGVAESLIKQLKNNNEEVHCAEKDGDYKGLFGQIEKDNRGERLNIIYLWAGGYQSFYWLLELAKALSELKGLKMINLNILTNNLYDITGDELTNPESALAVGPGIVIQKEYPGILTKCIDIDAGEINSRYWTKTAEQLLEKANEKNSLPLSAYRGGYEWVREFEGVQLDQHPKYEGFKRNGVYMITGGLGGIGLEIAEHLAKNYEARLVLTARTKLPEREKWEGYVKSYGEKDSVSEKIAKLERIEKYSGEVYLANANVADEIQMGQVLVEAKKKFGKINGIIHAAGSPDGGMIATRNNEMSEEVFASKVKGTLIIENIFKNEKLDFVVYFSSISSLIGTIGQVAYCSANAFLDSYAGYTRLKSGTRVYCVNWDTWQKVGMAAEAFKRLKGPDSEVPQDGLLPQEGIEALERIVSGEYGQIVVAKKDINFLYKNNATLGVSSVLEADSNNESGLAKTYGHEDYDSVTTTILNIFKDFYGVQSMGKNDNFFELGGSSLDMIQINIRLKNILETEIPITAMFNYPTVGLLTEFLTNRCEEEENDDTVGQESTKTTNNRLKRRKIMGAENSAES